MVEQYLPKFNTINVREVDEARTKNRMAKKKEKAYDKAVKAEETYSNIMSKNVKTTKKKVPRTKGTQGPENVISQKKLDRKSATADLYEAGLPGRAEDFNKNSLQMKKLEAEIDTAVEGMNTSQFNNAIKLMEHINKQMGPIAQAYDEHIANGSSVKEAEELVDAMYEKAVESISQLGGDIQKYSPSFERNQYDSMLTIKERLENKKKEVDTRKTEADIKKVEADTAKINLEVKKGGKPAVKPGAALKRLTALSKAKGDILSKGGVNEATMGLIAKDNPQLAAMMGMLNSGKTIPPEQVQEIIEAIDREAEYLEKYAPAQDPTNLPQPGPRQLGAVNVVNDVSGQRPGPGVTAPPPPAPAPTGAPAGKTVVKRGRSKVNGRPIVQYSDGTLAYGD